MQKLRVFFTLLSSLSLIACSDSDFQSSAAQRNQQSFIQPQQSNIGDSQLAANTPGQSNVLPGQDAGQPGFDGNLTPTAKTGPDTFISENSDDVRGFEKCAAKWGPLPSNVNRFVLEVIDISDIKHARKTLNLDFTTPTASLETVYVRPVAITGALNTINVRLMNPNAYYCLSEFAMIGSLNTINVFVHCQAKISDITPSLNVGYKNNAGGSSIGSFNNVNIMPQNPDGSACSG